MLIDGGFVETAPLILRNIAALGFEPRDVELLLNSHAHFDHAGGLSRLKEATGARLVAGHTRGCTTWSMAVEEGGRTYHLLFACSLDIPGYPLRDMPQCPTIVDDYHSSIAKLRALPCDVLLGPTARCSACSTRSGGLGQERPRRS